MRTDPACPLCGRDLADPQRIEVCGGCFASVCAPTAPQVTGEFAAVRLERLTEAMLTAPAPSPARPATAEAPACSWCGRGRAQVKKLLSSAGANICDGCVALCADILAAELGDDWSR